MRSRRCILAIAALSSLPVAAEELSSEERDWTTKFILSLNSTSPRIRKAAVQALAGIGLDAIPLVVKRSRQLHRDEAWEALADAFAIMGRADAAKRLRALETSWPHPARRRLDALVASLENAGPAAGGPKVSYPKPKPATLKKVRTLLAKFDGARSYSSNDENVTAIVDMGRPAVAALIRILREGRRGMLVSAAIDALTELVTEKDRPHLAGMLAEGVLEVAECLKRIPGKESLDALLVPLDRGKISYAVIEALRPYRDEARMRKALIRYLERFGKAQDQQAGRAAEFLGEIREYGAIRILEKLAAQPQTERRGVMRFLGNSTFRRGVATGLVKLGSRTGFPILIEILGKKTALNDWDRHTSGELLNDIVGQRIYIGSLEPRARNNGNFKEAAGAFRRWYAKHEAKLRFDRVTGRWSVG